MQVIIIIQISLCALWDGQKIRVRFIVDLSHDGCTTPVLQIVKASKPSAKGYTSSIYSHYTREQDVMFVIYSLDCNSEGYSVFII